jgi:hypothetical protein
MLSDEKDEFEEDFESTSDEDEYAGYDERAVLEEERMIRQVRFTYYFCRI